MVTTPIQRSLTERLRDRLQGRREDTEQGLALLDVLIGMAIFALIAIIALQALGQYRERAFESTALSDVNALSVELEAQFTDTQSYPTTGTGVAIDATTKSYTAGGVLLAAKASKGMKVAAYTLTPASNTYTLCLIHTSGSKDDAFASFDSATGQVKSGRSVNGAAVTCSYN